MKPQARLFLFVAAFAASACDGDRSLRPAVGTPSAAISDALHGSDGNRGFFLLPPMVPDPSAEFTAGEFNGSVSPVVLICEGTGLTGTACSGATVAAYTMTTGPGSETVRLSLTDEHYIVNWHTDNFSLNTSLTYRINVFVGTTLLGFADVELGANRGELKNVDTDEFVPLIDGRTLPIKFRIEDSALCGAPWTQFCNSETIVLADGGSVVLEGTGDRVDIPPQQTDRVITVTLTLCDGVDVDAPKYGNCLTVTSDPPLGDFRFSPTATVSICSIVSDGVPLPAPPQDDLITMYRQDNGDIFALPHADDFCTTPIGQGPTGLFGQLARALGRLFAPRALHASVAVLDVGEGGSTDYFSDFQLVLPVQMFPLDGTDGQTAEAGSPVETAPGVRVLDRTGQPVAGATVRFAAGAGSGTLDLGSTVPCGSDADLSCVLSSTDGIAAVASWTLGTATGAQSVTAAGRGIADPDDAGPFQPVNIDAATGDPIPSALQETVTVGTGEVVFTATAVSPVLIDFETYPNGTATCSDCAVGTAYAALGVIFSFTSSFTDQDEPHILLNSNNPQGAPNHDVTSPPSSGGGRWVGTTIMTFSGAPTAVRFEARVNNDIGEIPVAAFEPDGDAIPASQITRSNVVLYTPGTVTFRQEMIEVTNTAGIGRIELSGGGAGGFLILLDDLDFAPLGDQISFLSDRDVNSEIYVMNADGTGQTNLTNNSGFELQQRWSPDGTKLVFTSNRDGNSEIYVMNRDGSGQTRLTNNPASDQNPWWSPDGSRIVFESNRDGNNEIYVMNADGTGQTNVSNFTGADALPAWSPDGTKIAFQSHGGGTDNSDGDAEIYVVNADGTGATNLTDDGQFDMLPVWSPDGTKIAFQKAFDLEGEGFQFEIYVINAVGTGAANLTNHAAHDFDPQWAPVGAKLAFTSERDGNGEIYVKDLNTGGLTRLTTNAATDEQPAWSASGARIAFDSNRDGNVEIYVMNADGTGQTNLTNNSNNDRRARWAPSP
ncbi:MAG: hypothetical protein WD773_06650 [Gemmatimonadales bacterium]